MTPSPQDHTTRGFSLIELMIIMLIVGLLAAVALPAYVKYIRRSRSIEASANLRKMFDGSVSYFADEHSDRSGDVLPKAFPVNAGPTPAANSCCGQPADKCTPIDWRADPGSDTWNALYFYVEDPHHYWYSFASAGADQTAMFTARANGNLNCDSRYSTFERVGSVNAIGAVTGGSGLYKAYPLE